MKFTVTYECSLQGKRLQGTFEIDRDSEPLITDCKMLDLARHDSVKLVQSGIASIRIISISEIF